MYDISKQESYENVTSWLKELRSHADSQIVIMLVGNKCDLKHLRAIPTDEAKNFAAENKLMFIETSAMDATNVERAFQDILTEIYRLYADQTLQADFVNSNKPQQGQSIQFTPQQDDEKPKSNCC